MLACWLVLQVRSQYRKIFTAMGFQEMPTNNYVESSFWNFDSLFQPQQHPARDAHDTFFLTSPATSDTFPEDYLQRVKVCGQTGEHTCSFSCLMCLSGVQRKLHK